MILAVDAGNTRIKWGVHDGHAWRALGAVPHAERETLLEAWQPWAPVAQAMVANVAGADCAAQLQAQLDQVTHAVNWLRARAQLAGVRNCYEHPEQLGPDRFAALIGARAHTQQPCIVATAGTALTVDALSAAGEFLGGLIVPGLALMLQALTRGTADLKAFPGHFQAFPRNTADAMVSGGIQAACGAIMRMLEELAQREGQAPRLVLSGGASRAIAPHLSQPHDIIDTLVLDGLIRIIQK